MSPISQAGCLSFTIWFILSWILYQICLALYNISPLHKLYHFPGPKIAAVSYLYEAYYDWCLGGRYTNRIARMHDEYGPIVRINPDELHCSDPAFTEEIYAGSRRLRDKWKHQLNTGGAGPVSVTGFSTVPHELHRKRRSPLAAFFSRQNVFTIEPKILAISHNLADKMLASADKGCFDVKQAFNCVTADIISQYAFGQSMGFVDMEKWEPNFSSWVQPFFKSAYMMRHNTFARKLAHYMPFMTQLLSKDIQTVFTFMNVTILSHITAARENTNSDGIFANIIRNAGALSRDEYWLHGEAFNFLLAGTETTASVLTVFTFWALYEPAVYGRLKLDLANANIDIQTLKWTRLEKLPYLWATLQECLRMMPGVSHRSARIAREEHLYYKSADGKTEWVIPKGTPIGMSSMINHWDTMFFPNPGTFMPERWLLPDGQPNRELGKKLIAFGKGSRSCIGESLANCELYLMAAIMVLRVIPRAILMDTKESISYDHDMIVPQTMKGSISARISII